MSERLNIRTCANTIADALFRAAKTTDLAKIDIDGIHCAVAGYLAASNHQLSKHDIEVLVETTLRRVVERV